MTLLLKDGYTPKTSTPTWRTMAGFSPPWHESMYGSCLYWKWGKSPAIVMSGISGAFAVQLPGFHAKLFFFGGQNPPLFAVTKYAGVTFKYKSMKIGIEYFLCVCVRQLLQSDLIDSPNGGPQKKDSHDFNLVARSFNSSTNWKLHPDCWYITYNGMMEITHQYV